MKFTLFITFLLCSAFSVIGQDANRILENVRIGATLQRSDLHGVLRKGKIKSPLSLFMREKNIQFHYTDVNGAGKRFHMQHSRDDYDIYSVSEKGKKTKFSTKKLGEQVAGTDVSFEDLSLRFLYWPNARLEGEEILNTQKCWKVIVDNPNIKGPYGVVRVWVHKKHNAFMKIAGYNYQGQLIKEFDVTKVMKIEGVSTVKQIKVSPVDPKTGRKGRSTYIEFDKKRSKPRV